MTILIRIYLYFFVGMMLVFPSFAQAQEETCELIPEAIENLADPDLRTYNIWDVVYGVPEKDEVFYDFLPLDLERVIFSGAIRKDLSSKPFLLSTDRRGRIFWHWRGDEDNATTSIILKRSLRIDENSFAVAGRLVRHEKNEAIWIGVFDLKGQKLQEHIIEEADFDIEITDLETSIDGKGYILSALQGVSRDEKGYVPPHARFYLLDDAFNVIKDRSFIPAHENAIHDIMVATNSQGNKYYLAVGEARDTYSRAEGVVLSLDRHLNIGWRRSFPRGVGARFFSVHQRTPTEIIAVGDVMPTTEEAPQAGLVISIDADLGTERWVRYYTHPDIDYTIIDVEGLEDGRTLLVQAGYSRNEDDVVDHARYMMLSPRGLLMEDLGYSMGKGARPQNMQIGPDGRIYISGSALIEAPDPKDPENEVMRSQDGWLVVAEPPIAYEDPCIPQMRNFNDN